MAILSYGQGIRNCIPVFLSSTIFIITEFITIDGTLRLTRNPFVLRSLKGTSGFCSLLATQNIRDPVSARRRGTMSCTSGQVNRKCVAGNKFCIYSRMHRYPFLTSRVTPAEVRKGRERVLVRLSSARSSKTYLKPVADPFQSRLPCNDLPLERPLCYCATRLNTRSPAEGFEELGASSGNSGSVVPAIYPLQFRGGLHRTLFTQVREPQVRIILSLPERHVVV